MVSRKYLWHTFKLKWTFYKWYDCWAWCTWKISSNTCHSWLCKLFHESKQRTSPAGHWAFPFIDYDTKLVLPPTRRNRPKLPCTEALQPGHRPLWYVKNKRDTDLSISSPRWPHHRSCVLGLAQCLEGSNGTRTNFVSSHWIPLVLVLPESSVRVSGFECCVCTLCHSVICLYTMEAHTRPQTPTYIRT